ncbi:uncharacterized protein KGF55_005098 [Candida pseudojiufengensis]|uniref:uncharacterized protein n=1 Tax=Candida pseudojiufengensis TaxID=497109 RepID=UPI0022258EE5|nr:uncharacterized protein KGF55_005098 [Candida pseudojiufengensis]KAI5959866.1 hypothetical protein KGF55_005098 [Candida pseudojiufengensis]
MLRRLNKINFSQIRFNSSSLSVLNYDNNEISLKINDKQYTFKNVFLRDSCTSSESIDEATSQKLFTTAEGATNLSIKSEPRITNGKEPTLNIEWNNNGNFINSQYPLSFLLKHSNNILNREGKFFDNDRKIWDKIELESNLESINHTYEEFLNNDETFFKALHNLNKYGLCFINDIPHPKLNEMNESNVNEWPIANLANKFGYIKKTFYGSLFDVKNLKNQAKNIAYTNTFLPLHMDLLYYESPPGLQMLHAIQNSTLGGENIFCDSFLAANYVKQKDPKAYDALTKIPITYHYDNNNEYYYFKRPLIIEDKEITNPNFPKIHAINYSPPFQGPFEKGVVKENDPKSYSEFDDFIRGFKLFENFINDPKNHYEIKLPEGTCVIFENRRTLHSRNEFNDSNGGDRWLMGTYVDGDSFRSKLRIGYRTFGTKV